jgi:NhaP-type Na+/H+ or K+/H+ antiporter
LALSMPASPWRGDLLVVTYAVVLFTIVVQGLTMLGLLQALYGDKKPAELPTPATAPSVDK